jgi:hypothetical protein
MCKKVYPQTATTKWWSMTFNFTSVLWLRCMYRRTVWKKTLLMHFTKCMEMCAPMMAVCDIGWDTWMTTTWTQWICLAVDNHELSPGSWSNHQRWLNNDRYRYCSTSFNFRPMLCKRHELCAFTVSRKTCWQGWQSLLNSVTGNESWVNYSNPKTKWQNMEWHHITSLTKMKTK